MSGYIYALENSCMPGIFKVGRTDVDPFERATQISAATGVPVPFTIAAFLPCSDAKRSEKFVHDYISASRINGRREFFRCHYHDVVAAMSLAARLELDAHSFYQRMSFDHDRSMKSFLEHE